MRRKNAERTHFASVQRRELTRNLGFSLNFNWVRLCVFLTLKKRSILTPFSRKSPILIIHVRNSRKNLCIFKRHSLTSISIPACWKVSVSCQYMRTQPYTSITILCSLIARTNCYNAAKTLKHFKRLIITDPKLSKQIHKTLPKQLLSSFDMRISIIRPLHLTRLDFRTAAFLFLVRKEARARQSLNMNWKISVVAGPTPRGFALESV